MKRTINRIIIAIAVIALFCAQALATPEALVPVGKTVGIHLCGELTVAGVEEAAKGAGLQIGDRIVSVNGDRPKSIGELRSMIGKGSQVRFCVERGGRQMELLVLPTHTQDGAHIGIRVRDGITGVGTVTFYDPATGQYGALGHGVNDPEIGRRIPITGGSIMVCRVTDVVKGRAGHPGELRGAFSEENPIGDIQKNLPVGIFGTMDPPLPAGSALPLADPALVRTAQAQILSNVEGNEVQSFAVEILKVDPNDSEGRNFLLQVRDEELIARTGGIVQGMSGSPIVQDGRLIGAVTHVLVDDPTIGYGISIEKMLNAAA